MLNNSADPHLLLAASVLEILSYLIAILNIHWGMNPKQFYNATNIDLELIQIKIE